MYARLMSIMPRFQLSRLREIGWSKWDPIGVGGPEHDWAADEYDTHLLQAAGQLWHGQPIETVADYLVKVETEHLGLTPVPGIRSRALEVAGSVSEYVETLRS